MFNFIRNHKIISGVILVNVVAVICLIIAIIIYNSKTATVDILVAPNDAQILINGTKYDNNTSVNLAPGDYVAEISMGEMQSKTVNFSLDSDEFYRLYTYLLSEDGSFKYYDTHMDDEAILGRIVEFDLDDSALVAYTTNFDHVYSIVNVLPLYRSGTDGAYIDRDGISFDGDGNKIVDTSNCEAIVCLRAYGGGQNKELINKLITDAGYNPSDYPINFGDGE